MNIYTFQNDIAIIKIKSSYSHEILSRATKLPNVLENKFDKNSKRCKIYGYGKTNERFPNQLYYATVALISFHKCAILLGRVVAPIEGSGIFCHTICFWCDTKTLNIILSNLGSGQFCAMGQADACSGR